MVFLFITKNRSKKMAILQENNFREREDRLKKFWQDNQIYAFDEASDRPIYSVDTPPPYVSADHLHAGHFLSYSQTEFIVRYKRMKGYNVFYPMGFDDNGLPTERFVEKKYHIDKSKITRHEFVKLCLEETKIGSQTYKRLWTDLGISVDWSKTYSTIDPLCQRISQWSFIELYKQGKAYRKKEPMLWCSFCQTALAQADLEEREGSPLNVHERCGTVVEFIPTTQWFIDVLHIKDELIALGRELHWYPTHMRNMYEDWVNGLKWDWCVSRQRYYGVPFPIWFCKGCGEIIPADMSKLPVDPTEDSPSIEACPACGSREFIPDSDVMDTWATSSCSPFIIPQLVENKNVSGKIFPNSLRPQGFEIIRTWIFYTMVKAYYHFGTIPFADVMIAGHGQDERGRKISKRLGNYIEPEKLLAEYGADAIRYWATGATLGANHRFDLEDIKKGKHTVNKLWNAAKFCLTYIEARQNFAASPGSGIAYNLEPEDKWILHELNNAIRSCSDAFERYEYAEVRTVLSTFFWGTFCDYYLELIKHRATQESAKYTMFICLLTTLKLYAPILPFITEELYQLMYKGHEGVESIHKTRWPECNNGWIMGEQAYEQMKYFIEEVDAIRKEKKEKGLRYKDVLDIYTLKTEMGMASLREKLQIIFSIQEISPTDGWTETFMPNNS